MAIGIGFTATAATGSATSVTTPGNTSQATGSTFYVSGFYNTGAFNGWTDSKSNSYSQIGVTQTSSPGDARQDQKVNGAGGAGHTFTLNMSPASFGTIFAVEITGADTTAPLDQNNSNVDPTNPYDSNSVTTTQANELLIGSVFEVSSTTVVHTFNNSFTLDREEQDGVNFATGALGHRFVTSTLTTSTNVSETGTITAALVFIATFKEATAGGAARQQTLTLIGCGV